MDWHHETPMHPSDAGLYWKIYSLDENRDVGLYKSPTIKYGRQYYMIRTINHVNGLVQEMQISDEALLAVVTMYLMEKNMTY